jgi:hypothetical protein
MSFCVAGMIQLMVVLLENHSKKEKLVFSSTPLASPNFSLDITALKFGVNSV